MSASERQPLDLSVLIDASAPITPDLAEPCQSLLKALNAKLEILKRHYPHLFNASERYPYITFVDPEPRQEIPQLVSVIIEQHTNTAQFFLIPHDIPDRFPNPKLTQRHIAKISYLSLPMDPDSTTPARITNNSEELEDTQLIQAFLKAVEIWNISYPPTIPPPSPPNPS